ncbi:hypothetical protein ACG2LH_07665 [Zhouia sp. PK063]|uniref:hypothetical protein n=1 Tax=Zhouia sp. PK063 TaxID=3373602 RepID=UPI003797F47F
MSRKNKKRSFFILSSFIAILIAISPYIFYLYEGVPKVAIWKTSFFTFKSGYYENAYMVAWIFMNKFIPLYLLTIWFLTCKHWWYHIILIPIGMFAFQLFTALSQEARYIDEVEIYYIIPLMMIITPIVYLFRLKIFDKFHGIDLQKINEELKEYDKFQDDPRFREKYEQMKKEDLNIK